MNSFLLEIVTPERKVYTDQVDMVIVKGAAGDMGILAHHLPLVSPLKVAPVIVKIGNAKHYIAVSGGFIEVRKEKVVILAESAELPGEIDLARAEAAKDRAERRIADKKDELDYRRAEMALQRAVTRIEVRQHI
ncbi:MAG: synthase subunit epsilon [Bacilli bacterium]|nr:synthase subunit epsilon [Bacilli bacterium]